MSGTIHHPVDRGWAWMIVLGCSISIFIMGGLLRTFGIMLEEISRHFEIPMSVTILIMTVEGVFYTLSASLGVIIAEKFSARVVMLSAGVIGCLGTAIGSLTYSIAFLICTLGVGIGIANGFLHGNGLVMVSRYFDKRRALASGLAVAGGSIGQFVMPPIIKYLLNTYLLSGTLLIMGGIYLHLCITGFLYRPISFYDKRGMKDNNVENGTALKSDTKSDTPAKKTPEVFGDHESTAHDKLVNKHLQKLKVPGIDSRAQTLSSFTSVEDIVSASLISLSHIDEDKITESKEDKSSCCHKLSVFKTLFDLSLIKNLPFMYYVLTSVLCFVGFFNVIFFIPSHAVNRGFSGYESAFLISLNGIGDLMGRVGSGWFADLNVVRRNKILAFVTFLNGANCLLIPLANKYWWLSLHCVIYGFFCGAYLPLLPVITVDLFGLELLPNALAIILFAMGAVAAIEQPLLGLLADAAGSYDYIFYVSGGICIAAAIMALILPYIVVRQDKREPVLDLDVEEEKEPVIPSTIVVKVEENSKDV